MSDFLQKLLIQIAGGVVAGAILFFVMLPFRNTLDQLIILTKSVERSVAAITEAANIDPNKIAGVSDAVKTGSELVGEGVGAGAATAISRIKGALSDGN